MRYWRAWIAMEIRGSVRHARRGEPPAGSGSITCVRFPMASVTYFFHFPAGSVMVVVFHWYRYR